MQRRTSHVKKLNSLSIDASSVLQIGDSQEVNAQSNILAVQREKAIFYQHEFEFADYDMFMAPLAVPGPTEPICVDTFHDCPHIHVKKVNVPFAAASSVVHIGSTDRLTLETRVKNIRHLLRDEPKRERRN
ncbi:spore germination protein GerPE [Brevibacillus gelatini]|uniref:Spore germination protein GerPE n=1 Tax=Brevibacillus gelatini TaxID=1655277 RepID=A0A3M8ATR0_9BACL|nr:spore germination protein GerPE [Brevibacillus gelatini]RNB54037.1 spore germination protein GerPE [Brevibacillus gelatini]